MFGAGILTGYPSTTPFGFVLGSPNPWLISIAKETLGFRCLRFRIGIVVTHANILARVLSTKPYDLTSQSARRSPTCPAYGGTHESTLITNYKNERIHTNL